ncbi:MAG: hypothetical protein JXB47_09285 [Anaerolineae bacterium]|nr:hypothetical protein [Anaerolineae bacterium]
MDINKIGAALLVIALTVVSGYGDAQGFLHAARVWAGGQFIWREAAASGLGFAFGIITYWFAIRFMHDLGITAPEVQTLGWFAVTMIGVALFSGEFFKWEMTDRMIGAAVLTGIVWLMFRTGG